MRGIAAVIVALIHLTAGCGEEVAPPEEAGRPETRIYAALPTGKRTLVTEASILVNGPSRFEIELDVPGDILTSTDGSEPDYRQRGTVISGNRALVEIARDTTLRWRGVSLDGRKEAVRSLAVRVDRTPPAVTAEPGPGVYASAVTVRVSADEEATLYWTEDGRAVVPGNSSTRSAPLPVDLVLTRSVTLTLLVRDRAGNQTRLGPWRYEVDTRAPSTRVDPPGGHYLAPVAVRLTADDEEAVVHYTTDGSAPDHRSPSLAPGASLLVEADTELRFSAVDVGGNREPAQVVRYTVGPRAARPPARVADAQDHPNAGSLQLAAALIEAAGPLSGAPGVAGFGSDFEMFCAGRDAVEAALLQSGVGPHALHSPGLVAVSAAGEGAPDRDNNGSNLDDTFDARVAALAARVGAAAPAGLHPPSLFYERGVARLATPVPDEPIEDGRPAWVLDFGGMRWDVPEPGPRVVTAESLAGALRALAARARAATATQHAVGAGQYARDVAPVIGLRCAGCHRAGAVVPELDDGAALLDAGLFTRGDAEGARLLDLLSGAEPHANPPATPEQVAQVAAWIDAGAPVEPAERRPGVSADEGFFGLLAVDHAALALAHLFDAAIYRARARRLMSLDEAEPGPQYPASRATTTEGPAGADLPPRASRPVVEDAVFRAGEQARVLRGALALVALRAERPAIFAEPPLSGSAALPGAAAQAERLARRQVKTLLDLAFDADLGTFRGGWRVESGTDAAIDTVGAADAATAFFAAARLLDEPALADAARQTVAFLVAALDDGRHLYPDAHDRAGPVRGQRYRLGTQLAVLEALAADGGPAARGAAMALWAQLEVLWWDEGAGAWQTALGDDEYAYDAALVARVLDAVGAASAAGLAPGADQRLATFLDRALPVLRLAETWTCGEVGEGPDADGDGVPRPEAVRTGNGAPATFARGIRL